MLVLGAARSVRKLAVDVVRLATAVELLARPTTLIEVHRGRLVARCPGCRQTMALAAVGDLARIAAILAARPDPETRTWQVHETVADLERENVEHGIPVPAATRGDADLDEPDGGGAT